MTGPEHYTAAEDLIANLTADGGTFDANCIAEAQVHATLALAAAIAMDDRREGFRRSDRDAWDKAAGSRADQ